MKPKIAYLQKISSNSIILIFNIITTKRNKTAIAPTYTIKNIRATNSIFNIINTKETLQKTKIKYKIECIGFFETIIKKLQITEKMQKNNRK